MQYTEQELKEILDKHERWLKESDGRSENDKANLYGADLCGANLCGANLCGANLRDAKNVPFVPYACPDFGFFVGFKKASGYIVVLEIPEDARRLSATGRKCRCDKAKVLQIQTLDGAKADVEAVASNYNPSFVYRVGEIVTVEDFNEDR